MNKTLVTGATGFIGSQLVRRLLADGRDVAIFRRASSSLRNLADCQVDDIVGDLADKADLARAMEGCQSVFHLAACAAMLDRLREERERTNVTSVSLLRDAALESGHKIRLVHCSSVAAVGLSGKLVELNEDSSFNLAGIHYALTKKQGEEIIMEGVRLGLNAVIVNPATVIGEGMSWTQTRAFVRAAAGKSVFYPPGGTCLSYVDDVVNGMILAEKNGRCGERYILGGTNMSFVAYFQKIAAISGASSPRVELPGWILPSAGRMMELCFGKVGRDVGRLAAGFGYYSSKKAVEEIGYDITPIDAVIRTLHEKLVCSRHSES